MRLLSAEQFAASNGGACHPILAAFARHAPCAIQNVVTRMHILDTEVHAFPVSVNDGGERTDNSYVVSPLTAYTGYAEYELAHLGHAWLTWPLRGLVRTMGGWLASAHIDRLVQVNNWLLSTNVYPCDWQGADLPEMTELLVEAFPGHAICFRSLNPFSNTRLLERLTNLGYLAIPSRQVYLFDARAGEEADFLQRHNGRMDARLLRKTPYQLAAGSDLRDEDYPRLAHLYNLLYLEKYCPLNPQFSADWLRAGQRDGWLELHALRSEEGLIDGVLGWFGTPHILTAPVVGYDTALPQKLGLYRLITRLCLQEAVRRRCLLNFSSGAAHFKRLRGGEPTIEYSLVYVRHLPAARRRVWHVLSRLLHGIGVPVMRTFKL